MNLDEVVAELLAGPLSEFTSRRNERRKSSDGRAAGSGGRGRGSEKAASGSLGGINCAA